MPDKNKKRKRQPGERGAVSVFLTLVLVPCIVLTCIFGDLSRVQLSQAAAASAGDLALYSLMSRYDEALKEYYGLVASCQNIDDFYDTTALYFTGMMQAEGVPELGSELFNEYLRELQEGDFSDFLRAEIQEVGVKAAENGSLGENPALIEDGIVEFMKYRGPVELVSGLIDNFDKMDIAATMDETEKNEKVVEKKQEYAEQQGELLDTAFYIYLAIREYEKSQEREKVPSFTAYRDLETRIEHIRNDLKAVTSLVARYYFPGTENLTIITIPELDMGSYTVDKKDVGEEVEKDGELHYCIDNQDLQDRYEDIDEAMEAIEAAADKFVATAGSIPDTVGSNNPVVYCLNMQEALTSSSLPNTLRADGDELLTLYAELEAAAECEPYPENSDLPDNWEETIEDEMEEIEDFYDEYLASDSTAAFRKKLTSYVSVVSQTYTRVANRSYTFTSQTTGGNITINDFCNQIRNHLPEAESWLTERIKQLDIVLEGGYATLNGKNKLVLPIDALIEKARTFTNARNDWGSIAASTDTDYAADEYTLYQGAQSASEGGGGEDKEIEGEKIAAKITPENVEQLKSRLMNIRSDMQTCLDALKSFTYGGTPVKDFTSGEQLIGAANTVVRRNTSYSENETNNTARGYADSLIVPAGSKAYTAPSENKAPDGNDPVLANSTPELYKFLKELLQDKEDSVESEVDKQESRQEEFKGEGDKAKTNATKVDNIDGLGFDVEFSHGGEAVGLGTSIGSLADMIGNLSGGNADELRDQLYVCEYIMDMFGYSTLNNEGRYRLQEDETDSSPTYSGGSYSFNGDITSRWNEEDPRDVMENQSLTNRPLTGSYSHANLGEVEYILYGNTGLKANIGCAYRDIFVIREAMNLVSGFVNFYGMKTDTGKTINGIATAIASATAGIVPVPVTKCVLIAVLATLESASDLSRLKAGGPIPLYKTSEDDWVCSINVGDSDDSFGSGQKNSITDNGGMFYSSYLYLFVLLGVTNESTYNDMLLRIGDLIQANLRRNGSSEDFTLAKAQVYYDLEATVRVRPLMMSLPLVLNSVQGAQDMVESADWCTYKLHVIRGYS